MRQRVSPREHLRRGNAASIQIVALQVGLVTMVSGWFGVIAVVMVFRAMVARSASSVSKLCTSNPSGVRLVVCYCTAASERCACATTLVRSASAACLSVVLEQHRREALTMCHSR
jgi:hypothetical protein